MLESPNHTNVLFTKTNNQIINYTRLLNKQHIHVRISDTTDRSNETDLFSVLRFIQMYT